MKLKNFYSIPEFPHNIRVSKEEIENLAKELKNILDNLDAEIQEYEESDKYYENNQNYQANAWDFDEMNGLYSQIMDIHQDIVNEEELYYYACQMIDEDIPDKYSYCFDYGRFFEDYKRGQESVEIDNQIYYLF